MSESSPQPPTSRPVFAYVLCSILIFAALGFLVLAVLPLSFLQAQAAGIRNVEDLTPERLDRFGQVCWFFTVVLALWGIATFWWRETVQKITRQFRSDLWLFRVVLSDIRPAVPKTVWFLFVAGIGLRLWFLNLPMAYDESYSFLNFASRNVILAIGDYNSTNNHLFNSFLMHWSYQLFGQEDWALRLPVFCFGVALLPSVWFWAKARFGTNVALIALALIAISPAIVSYSVNARGYLYVTTCAVLLDLSLFKISERNKKSSFWWLVAWIATVVGCWSMPLMIYPLTGIFGWFVFQPIFEKNTAESFSRIRTLIPFFGAAIPAVILLYTPAYIFRGLMFLNDPIVRHVSFAEWLQTSGNIWSDAFVGWFAIRGMQLVFLILFLIGMFALSQRKEHRLSILFPFLAAGLLMALQQVTPPPRILLYLAPWASVVCALGFERINHRAVNREKLFATWSILIVIAGGASLLGRPFLYDEVERRDYASIPAVIERLEQETGSVPATQNRLFAPLPCDLPAIYYMEKQGFRVPVNGTPTPSEALWLISRPGQTPQEILSTPLVDLADVAESLGPWEEVARFPTLILFRSQRH